MCIEHWLALSVENLAEDADDDFLADRTNGRAIGTVLRLSVVCDVMYCG